MKRWSRICNRYGYDDKNRLVSHPEDAYIDILLFAPGERGTSIKKRRGMISTTTLLGGMPVLHYFEQSAALVMCTGEIMNPNRTYYDCHTKKTVIIFGTFFICGLTPRGDFTSLSLMQQAIYMERFKTPEYFLNGKKDKIVAFA